MKTMKSFFLLAMAGIVSLGFIPMKTFAQDATPQPKKEIVKEEKIIRRAGTPHKPEPQIPNLTEDQKKKIKDIRMKEKRETLQMKNLMNEKNARLKTLNSYDKPDMAEINKTVDELMALKGGMMKKQMGARQEIRALLNDEQRLAFDTRKPGKKKSRPMPARHPEE